MLRTDHMVFPVWDAAASLRFYADVLGLPLVASHQGDDWGGKPWLMMIFALGDGRELVLVSLRGAQPPPPSELAPDVRHYAFSVSTADEQAAWIAKLKAAGVEFWEEDHGDQQSVYFADPNGVVLEITTPASSPAGRPDPNARAAADRWIAQSRALTH
jgi:catechol 2,3-dioxygenase-like lactoylglutathione lyase family enzyme